MSAITSALVHTVKFVDLFVSSCLTSWQHRLTSIWMFCHILLPCPCSNFAQNVIV